MGGAAADETGARIGGARAAGSGAPIPFFAAIAGRKSGGFGGTELWPLRAVHISAGGGGELYIAMPAGRTA